MVSVAGCENRYLFTQNLMHVYEVESLIIFLVIVIMGLKIFTAAFRE